MPNQPDNETAGLHKQRTNKGATSDKVASSVVKPAKLTTKQRKLIKGVVEGKTQKQAAIDAGYSPKYAESAASHELNKAQVKATLQDLMEHMGLSNGALLIKHKELLNAQKQLSGVREAGSESIEFVEVPDHAVQAKALEMAYKLKGAFIDKSEIKHLGEVIHKIERVVVRPK